MSFVSAISDRAAAVVIPAWAYWLAGGVVLTAIAGSSYGFGRLHEARIGAKSLADYKSKQGAQTVRIVEKQAEVRVVVQTKYVDRIKKIYVQGERIETLIPQYITAADTARFGVNAGFVRIVDAAWTGDSARPASDADREPADLPLDGVASIQAGNATTCLAWREKVYAWRDFYARQQVAINGKAGAWAAAPDAAIAGEMPPAD